MSTILSFRAVPIVALCLLISFVSEAFKLSSLPTSNQGKSIDDLRRAGLLIPKHELKMGNKELGQGAFGDVFLGTYRSKQVAVKLLKSGNTNELLHEADFMIGLKNPYLVGLIGIVIDGSNVYMLTEYVPNGNLLHFLRSRGRKVSQTQLLHFALNVAQGMAYMESKRLVHRDLAARNILLDKNLIAKISDFGLSISLNKPILKHENLATEWTAPEALQRDQFSCKSDVWSFGVLLWEIFSFGSETYPGIPQQDVLRRLETGYRMKPPPNCPIMISRLMNATWQLNPSSRPTFAEIVLILKNIKKI